MNFVDKITKLSNGDLNVELNIKSKDEIGELSIAFNKFVQFLRKFMIEVNSLSNFIDNTTQNIVASMDNCINGKNSKYYSKLQ